MQSGKKTKSMFLVVIIEVLNKLHYTLVSTRYDHEAKGKSCHRKRATAQKNTKTHSTEKKSLVETAEVFFRGPGEAVKFQPRHTTLAIILL